MELKGKKAVVTGASRGIGRAIALELARQGADVVVTGRSMEKLQDVIDEVKTQGSEAYGLCWDIKDVSLAAEMVARADELLGGLDVWVNNAGVVERAEFLEMTEEVWDEVLDTNLKATYFLNQAVANHLIAADRRGKIINMASETGFQPHPSAYGCSKWGVVCLSMGMARKLYRKGIIVSSVAPGPVATEMMNYKPGDDDFYDNSFGKLAQPQDIANTVAFLASDRGSKIAGRPVFVSGGLDWSGF